VTPTAGSVTERGERTRARILEAALRSFEEHGYEATTMRAIAADAGVSVGSSYFYFPTKTHLVQAFYRHTHDVHLAEAAPVLASQRTLRARLRGVMHAKIDGAARYHHAAASLFSTAADPTSPTSPFSPESAPLRDEVIGFFAEVVRGSRERIPADIEAELPRLLWLWHMGVLLFWVHDGSPGCRRTHQLIDQSVEVIATLLTLSQLPLMRRVRQRVLALVETVAGAELLSRAIATGESSSSAAVRRKA
jgi:AcrR family transcriptional regulator